MSLQSATHSTLVLHAASLDAVALGCGVKALPGVAAVTVDPGRSQLVVRYDGSRLDAQRIRQAVRPQAAPLPEDTWLALLPKVGRAVPVVAALLV